MKRILSFLMVAALFAVSCDKYDDTKLWDEIRNFNDRITKLEQSQNTLNTNIAALQAIVSALQNNISVTSVVPVIQNGKEIGYTINFSSGNPVTVLHGTDGKDGATPVIGVRADTDGKYYWTINGEWLRDSDGDKVPAQGSGSETAGKDGITPQLRINSDTNFWEVSYDNGATWTSLKVKATGEQGPQGDSIFESVSVQDDTVTFTLSDGSTITLPLGTGGDKIISEEKTIKGIECVYIPEGTIGIRCTDINTHERGTAEVNLTPFYMGKYEVTNAQYCEFLNDRNIGKDAKVTLIYGEKTLVIPSEKTIKYEEGKWIPQEGYDNFPIANISWYGCSEFCEWAGGRLPTWAQWRYAALAGSEPRFTLADDAILDYAWCYENSDYHSHEVGQKRPNAWGLYDTLGNVQEYCCDRSGYYPLSGSTNPVVIFSRDIANNERSVEIGGGDYTFSYKDEIQIDFLNGGYPNGSSNHEWFDLDTGFRIIFPATDDPYEEIVIDYSDWY